jgi:hypothetical protein
MVAAMHEHVTKEMRSCAEICHGCHDTCLETIGVCLHMGGPHADPHHIRLMMDCVSICHTSGDFLLRGSDLHHHTCRACAEVCAACAKDCDRFSEDHMKRCAETCRRCAESCRKMSA